MGFSPQEAGAPEGQGLAGAGPGWGLRADSAPDLPDGWPLRALPRWLLRHYLPPRRASPPAASCCSFKLNCSPRY